MADRGNVEMAVSPPLPGLATYNGPHASFQHAAFGDVVAIMQSTGAPGTAGPKTEGQLWPRGDHA